MSSRPPSLAPIRITVVESEACHFCDQALRTLSELAAEYPLTVETVDLRSDTGQRLMRTHRASMSPLVLVDGTFFSHGRLPRRKLTAMLRRWQARTDARVG